MILAVTADLHITERPAPGGYTLEEQVVQLEWIGDDAADKGAAVMLVAGDLFDRASTPAERNAALYLMRGWSARMPVVIVRGNHDRPGDLDYLGAIRSINHIEVVDRPRVLFCGLDGGELRVACLPWPRKAILAEWSGRLADTDATVVEHLQAILRGLREELAGPGHKVLLAHAELAVAVLDNGQPVAGNCDVALSEEDLLSCGADVVLLGHIHRHQILSGGRIVYVGAPRPNRFGEKGPHGYCLVELPDGGGTLIQHVEAPGRKMVTYTGGWCGSTLTADGSDIVEVNDLVFDEGSIDASDVEGVAVRLTYEVLESERAAAAEVAEARKAELLAAGAHSVKIVPTIRPTVRVRAETTVGATVKDRLRDYWDSKGGQPFRNNEIMAKLDGLEDSL